VMPKMFAPGVRAIIKPHPVFAAGLALAFFLFTYVCIFRLVEIF